MPVLVPPTLPVRAVLGLAAHRAGRVPVVLLAGVVHLNPLLGVHGVHPLAPPVGPAALYALERLLYLGQRALFAPPLPQPDLKALLRPALLHRLLARRALPLLLAPGVRVLRCRVHRGHPLRRKRRVERVVRSPLLLRPVVLLVALRVLWRPLVAARVHYLVVALLALARLRQLPRLRPPCPTANEPSAANAPSRAASPRAPPVAAATPRTPNAVSV